jgi:hypothetical protein
MKAELERPRLNDLHCLIKNKAFAGRSTPGESKLLDAINLAVTDD